MTRSALALVAAILLLSAPLPASAQHGGVREHDARETRSGPCLSLSLGKEWWVSDNWGLGIAGGLVPGRAKGKDRILPVLDPGTWRALGLNLLFSATFN